MFRGLFLTNELQLVACAWLAATLACLNGAAGNAAGFDAEALRTDITGTFGGGNLDMRDLVRLSFHDCTSAACDGCIDVDDPENNGLAEDVTAIDAICANHAISRADCYAAAGSIAIEEAAPGGGVTVPLLFGRADAANCGPNFVADPEGNFPSGMDGVDATFGYFSTEFGFTDRETVAIMGVHTLGQADPENSGFDGPWTNDPDTLDNEFWVDMLDAPWNVQELDSGDFQWEQGNRIMLNSDMAMILDPFAGGGGPGEPVCNFNGNNACPESPTRSVAQDFADDNGLWLTEFVAAFVKMVSKGCGTCSEDAATAVAPTTGTAVTPTADTTDDLNLIANAPAPDDDANAAANDDDDDDADATIVEEDGENENVGGRRGGGEGGEGN